MLANPLHDKHLFAHVTQVPKKIFKIFICVGEMVTPIGVKVKMQQYGYIML
jgi:hypothetical protein